MSHRALGNQFHGTNRVFHPGDVISPVKENNNYATWEGRSSTSHSYAVDDPGEAAYFGSMRTVSDSHPYGMEGADPFESREFPHEHTKVYAVEPVDSEDVEYDPNFHLKSDRVKESQPIHTRSSAGWKVSHDVSTEALDVLKQQTSKEPWAASFKGD